MIRKVNSFIQNQECENGATCLAMICDFFGHRLSVDEACVLCDVTANGSTVQGICHGAGDVGLNAESRDAILGDIDKTSFPCIAVMSNGKYVVLEGIEKDEVFYCNTIGQHCRVSAEEFEKLYAGSIICFHKNDNFISTKEKDRLGHIISLFLQENKGSFIGYVAVALAASFFTLAEPHIIKNITNAIFDQNRYDQMIFLGAYLFICAASICLRMISSSMSVDTNTRIFVSNEAEYTLSTLNVSPKFYERNGESDLVIRKGDNSDIIRTITQKMLHFTINAVMVFFCTVYMLSQSYLITLAVILLNALAYFTLSLNNRAKSGPFTKMVYHLNEVSHFIYVSVPILNIIKSAGTEYLFFRKHIDILSDATEHESDYIKTSLLGSILPRILFSLIQTVVLIIGIAEISLGANITYGVILSSYAAYNIMSAPLQSLINSTADIPLLKQKVDRVLAIRNQSEKKGSEFKEAHTEKAEGILEGKIEMKNVSYSFSRYGEPFIKDLSFTVNRGEHVAFVGKSGSGKTTIKNILLGRYIPISGDVLYDDIKLQNISKQVLADSVGAVDQQIILFEDSVENNVKMWDDTIEDYQMALAMYDACIYDTIISKKKGLSSKIEQNGSNFSGGENQRLEIARALCKDPRILILDEATSSLDANTEKMITDNIKKRNITTITIAHRLSTIRESDRIFVIDNGQIVAEGTHEALMQSCKLYNELVVME